MNDQYLVLKPIVLQLLAQGNIEWKNDITAMIEFQGTLEQCINMINVSIQHNNHLLSNLEGEILWQHYDGESKKWCIKQEESSEVSEEESYERIVLVMTFDNTPFEKAIENIDQALKTTKGTLHLGTISNVNCAIITKRN